MFSVRESSAANPLPISALEKASHFTDSLQYAEVLKGLLAKNWSLAEGPIKVWHKDDPFASPREDFSEVKEIKIKDANQADPEDLGLDIGFPLNTIYAGPYLAQHNNKNYAFLMTIDSRTWGSKHNRCFVFYKELGKIIDSSVKTSLISIQCDKAQKIKSSATFPKIEGYTELNNEGKNLLNELSNKEWAKKVSVANPYFEGTTIDWKENFTFSFWNNFTFFNYFSVLSTPSSDHRVGPFDNSYMPEIVQIGMRVVSEKITEFVIWAHRPDFMSQGANMMTFARANDALWSAKSYEEVEEIKAKTSRTFCYEGFDCSKRLADERKWPSLQQPIEANYIVLRYDLDLPNQLVIRYEMVDPRFPSLSSSFLAE